MYIHHLTYWGSRENIPKGVPAERSSEGCVGSEGDGGEDPRQRENHAGVLWQEGAWFFQGTERKSIFCSTEKKGECGIRSGQRDRWG